MQQFNNYQCFDIDFDTYVSLAVILLLYDTQILIFLL